jgi:hypothetical protein
MPTLDTVATPVEDDCQVASTVTICVVRSDIVARAKNCDVTPTEGATPDTATDETVGAAGAVGAADVLGALDEELPPLHAHTNAARQTAPATDVVQRLIWVWIKWAMTCAELNTDCSSA